MVTLIFLTKENVEKQKQDRGKNMLLFQQIEEQAHSHTDARRTIGDFLLKEKSNVKQYTMQEIADMTYTSKSSLVRFAKTLGFQGWKEFIEKFLSDTYYEESHYTDIDPNFPIEEGETTKDIIYKVSNLMVESILDTTDQLNLKQVDKAVDHMISANQIALLGQSPNTYLGNLFKRKMVSIGKNVLLSSGWDQGLMARTLQKGDCAILISYSGNNEERVPMNFIPMLKEKEVFIIAITGLGSNFLRRNADCILSMSSRERLYTKIGTFSTEESIAFILNTLYACYFTRNYQENLEYKVDTAKHLEKRFSRYADIREEQM